MKESTRKVNEIFKGLTARKISIISRLSGLNDLELNIMKLTWLKDYSNAMICDEIGISESKLIDTRNLACLKILDGLDLYRDIIKLAEEDALKIQKVFTYAGLFYDAQDELIRFFLRNNNDIDKQKEMVEYLASVNDAELFND